MTTNCFIKAGGGILIHPQVVFDFADVILEVSQRIDENLRVLVKKENLAPKTTPQGQTAATAPFKRW
ncbi:MAG: hypothetical protein AB3N11_11365 [Arenibacterium sp.]